GFRESDEANLSAFHQFGHCSDGFFYGSFGIDAMLVVEIDVIDAEAFQRGVAGSTNVFPLATYSPVARVLFLTNVGELGSEEYLVATIADRLSDQFFIVAHSIDICSVQKVDPEIECAEDGGSGFFVVALAVEFAHAHASESHTGDDCALRTKLNFVHVHVLLDGMHYVAFHFSSSFDYISSLIFLRRSALVMTETELKLMAAAAIVGWSSRSKNGYRTPAAIGTPSAL